VWLTRQTSWQVTLLTILIPGILGAILVRWEGRRCLDLVRTRVSQGEVPGEVLLDGLLIVVAGVLLISPGVLTDVAGLALLLRPVRRFVRNHLSKRIRSRIVKVFSATVHPATDEGSRDQGPIVDVESKPTKS